MEIFMQLDPIWGHVPGYLPSIMYLLHVQCKPCISLQQTKPNWIGVCAEDTRKFCQEIQG